MTFRHGKSTALFLDSLDASPYFNTADSGRSIGTSEVTAFGAQAKAYIAAVEDAVFSASGFFDGDVGKIDDRLNILTNAAAAYPATYCPDGGAVVGRLCRVLDLINTNIGASSPVASATALKLSAQVTGGADWGRVLNDQAQNTGTTLTGASVDWGVGGASTVGGQVNIHVTYNTRSTTTAVKLQHSTDNSVWTDLTGTAQTVPAGQAVDATHPFGAPIAYALNIGGTVNRYLRAVITPTAGTGAISAVVAFARF